MYMYNARICGHYLSAGPRFLMDLHYPAFIYFINLQVSRLYSLLVSIWPNKGSFPVVL